MTINVRQIIIHQRPRSPAQTDVAGGQRFCGPLLPGCSFNKSRPSLSAAAALLLGQTPRLVARIVSGLIIIGDCTIWLRLRSSADYRLIRQLADLFGRLIKISRSMVGILAKSNRRPQRLQHLLQTAAISGFHGVIAVL